ncbi:MAG TPA: mitofilin family membrane protein [Stellaceae bacterium]|nr:mitofilin family membrane protein [Stellaceae bacterium]
MSEQHGDAGPERAPDRIPQAPPPIDARAKAPPQRRRERRLWPALLLLAVVAAGAIASAPYWAALLPWAAPDDRAEAALGQVERELADMAQRQAALTQRLAGVEERLAGAPASGSQQETAAALRQLADRLTLLEQRPPPAGDPAQLAALGETASTLAAGMTELRARLDKLEARVGEAEGSPKGAALLLALGQLRGALDSGRPFAAELARVKALARDRPELAQPIDALAGAAATGVASLGTLMQRFTQEVAPALLRAPPPPESDDIGDRIMARLRSLVVIHRIGDARDPVESAVERAEAALAGNDLAGAVAALEALPAREAAPAQGWLAAAHQRLAAAEAAGRLDAGISARLAGGAAPEH